MPALSRKLSLAEPVPDRADEPDCDANSRWATPASQNRVGLVCFGTGMEVVIGKGAHRCSCRASNQRPGFLEQARLPHRYERCTLENYRPSNHSTQLRAFNCVFKLVEEYPG